jgi:hypothetical protein
MRIDDDAPRLPRSDVLQKLFRRMKTLRLVVVGTGDRPKRFKVAMILADNEQELFFHAWREKNSAIQSKGVRIVAA